MRPACPPYEGLFHCFNKDSKVVETGLHAKTYDALAPIGNAKLDPPPPSAALLERVDAMRPVKPRSRFDAFLAVLLIGLVWPAFTLLHRPLRPDLGALPPVWVFAGAAIWGAALLTTLAAALVPRRGDVLPSAPQASRTAAVALLVLLSFSALGTVSVPGVSLRPEDFQRTLFESCLVCGSYVLGVAGLVLALGVFALRGALPMGGAGRDRARDSGRRSGRSRPAFSLSDRRPRPRRTRPRSPSAARRARRRAARPDARGTLSPRW